MCRFRGGEFLITGVTGASLLFGSWKGTQPFVGVEEFLDYHNSAQVWRSRLAHSVEADAAKPIIAAQTIAPDIIVTTFSICAFVAGETEYAEALF